MIEISCKQCHWTCTSPNKPQQSQCSICGQPLHVTVLVAPARQGKVVMPAEDVQTLMELAEKVQLLRQQIRQAIVGQDQIITFLFTALLADGHCLLEGVPGLAKTLMVHSLSQTLGLEFKRIQFTPDMMPADITGTEIPRPDRPAETQFRRGPVFANFILADEINRTPPKTQAALLEAMQEKSVTVGNISHQLERPFLVMATQNPVEQEGTYPLPEAQQDRFLFKLLLTYPSDDEEFQIMRQPLKKPEELEPVFQREEIVRFQQLVDRMAVSDRVCRYAWLLARSTRPFEPQAVEVTNEVVEYGAGPRASLALLKAAKALAAIEGQPAATAKHVQRVAPEVLRHRIILKFDARDTFEQLQRKNLVSPPQSLGKRSGQIDDLEPDVVIRELLAGKSAELLKQQLKAYLQ